AVLHGVFPHVQVAVIETRAQHANQHLARANVRNRHVVDADGFARAVGALEAMQTGSFHRTVHEIFSPRRHRGHVLRLGSGCALMKNSAHGDSSMGSELKAVEEACREVLERSNHANSASLRCDLLPGLPILLRAPRTHGAHPAGSTYLCQTRLEDLMN